LPPIHTSLRKNLFAYIHFISSENNLDEKAKIIRKRRSKSSDRFFERSLNVEESNPSSVTTIDKTLLSYSGKQDVLVRDSLHQPKENTPAGVSDYKPMCDLHEEYIFYNI
jgi:hypothetical protein